MLVSIGTCSSTVDPLETGVRGGVDVFIMGKFSRQSHLRGASQWFSVDGDDEQEFLADVLCRPGIPFQRPLAANFVKISLSSSS